MYVCFSVGLVWRGCCVLIVVCKFSWGFFFGVVLWLVVWLSWYRWVVGIDRYWLFGFFFVLVWLVWLVLCGWLVWCDWWLSGVLVMRWCLGWGLVGWGWGVWCIWLCSGCWGCWWAGWCWKIVGGFCVFFFCRWVVLWVECGGWSWICWFREIFELDCGCLCSVIVFCGLGCLYWWLGWFFGYYVGCVCNGVVGIWCCCGFSGCLVLGCCVFFFGLGVIGWLCWLVRGWRWLVGIGRYFGWFWLWCYFL